MNLRALLFLGLFSGCLAARPFDIQNYSVKFEINPQAAPDHFDALSTTTFTLKEDARSIELDAEGIEVKKIEAISPAGLSPTHRFVNPSILTVDFGNNLKKGTPVILAITYGAKIYTEHSGLFSVTDPDAPAQGPLLFTQFEPYGARRFFPCDDEPASKATTEISVGIPAKYLAVSNGRLLKDEKYTKDGESWHRVHWKQEKPHSTYLISLAIAPFEKLTKIHRNKELSFWFPQGRKSEMKFTVENTEQAMRFFESYLGASYPWNKYATVLVPTFFWGGMENTSSTHLHQGQALVADDNAVTAKLNLLSLVSHELAHQWFGDWVTMKSWDDLWLNESFASFFGMLASNAILKNDSEELGDVVFTWDRYFRQENGPRSHPIVNKNASSASDSFDAISYTKGQQVLRMLEYYVGDRAFRKGLSQYLNHFALSNATNEDFFDSIAKASKTDLKDFRDSWLLKRGYPIITYQGQWNPETKSYTLGVSQRPNHDEDKHSFVFKLPVAFHRVIPPKFSKTQILFVKDPYHTLNVKLPAEPQWVSVNSRSIVLGRVLPEHRQEDRLALQLRSDPDLYIRTWAAYQLMDRFLFGESISELADMELARHLSTEKDPYVRIATLAGLSRASVRWLTPHLSKTILELTRSSFQREPANDGERLFRTKLLKALGKVQNPETIPFLSELLQRQELGIDDLTQAAAGIALQGEPKALEALKTALKIHSKRGYRYESAIYFAFGAYENIQAAAELKGMLKTAQTDVWARIRHPITDNQTLRRSPEWAQFLKEVALDEGALNVDTKVRLFETVEDLKLPHLKAAFKEVFEKSKEARLKESARKMLEGYP